MTLFRGAALTLLLWASGAPASVIHRCVAADGVLVYSDRSCQSQGIAERLPRAAVHEVIGRTLNLGCAAHSPQAMRDAVADAIDRRDFNALSGLYNFDGRSRQSAAPVVSRLQRMTRRPAVEIELVAAQSESLFDVWMVDLSVLPQLRVTQFIKGDAGPLSIEIFGLMRSAGCVWLAR